MREFSEPVSRNRCLLVWITNDEGIFGTGQSEPVRSRSLVMINSLFLEFDQYQADAIFASL